VKEESGQRLKRREVAYKKDLSFDKNLSKTMEKDSDRSSSTDVKGLTKFKKNEI
jgi:hypothetical protein